MPYNAPTVQSVASAALTTVDAQVHALTAALLQAVYNETLQKLHSTCALCIIHIYISLGNGYTAVPSQLCQHTNTHAFVGKLGDLSLSAAMSNESNDAEDDTSISFTYTMDALTVAYTTI